MSITMELPERYENQLADRAAKSGQSLSEYTSQYLLRKLAADNIDVILAPVRKEFAESGMTDDEFGELIEQARQEVWAEQQAGINAR